MSRRGDLFPVRDPVKKTLFIPKLLLESTNFWPEKRSFLSKATNWVMLAICVFIESGQVAFVVANIHDITRIAAAMSTVSTTFQAITKMSFLYLYGDRLKNVLRSIWYEFWPANIAGPKIAKYLQFYNKIVILATVIMLTSAILFACGFLSSPLRSGNRVLPFEAIYPFDWSKSPSYEIIYVIEWMTNIAFIVAGICGHDYLFVGICANIVAQYILLREIASNLGTEKVPEITEKLSKFIDINFAKTEDENSKLLKLCVAHHVILTRACKEVADIFSFSCFVQLFSSVTALCVAALIMTFAEVDVTLFTTVSSYLFGHLLQLFLFCTLGNEVTDHASRFPGQIFDSKWYNIEDVFLKKDLVFVIRRCQQDIKIEALGIKTLDFQTFIGVLRLSFSFYTMLSALTNI